MKKFAPLVIALMLLGSLAQAESIDEAEAKKQGISVDAVRANRFKDQNDVLQAKVADLQKKLDAEKKQAEELKKQVADLTAKVQEMQASMSPAAKAKLGKDDAISTAIKDHKIVDGMTVDQATQAIGKLQKNSSSSDGDVYVGSVFDEPKNVVADKGSKPAKKAAPAGLYYSGIAYTLIVRDGRVVSWESKAFHQDNR